MFVEIGEKYRIRYEFLGERQVEIFQ